MKKLILLLFWFASIQVVTAAVSPGSKFQEGTKLLRKEKYEQAISTFEALEKEGLHEAGLYNNLGVAYLHTKQKGKAVVYFEKALLLAPLDAQIIQNSELVAVGKTPAQTGLYVFVQENESALLKAGDLGTQAAVILLFLSSIIFLLSALKNDPITQKRWGQISKILVLSSVALFVVSYGVSFSLLQTADAVAKKSITGKMGPGTEARDITELKEGEKLQIDNQFKDWYKVKTSNGTEAWVKAGDIQVL